MVRSLRWRLLVWQAVILLAVVVGFGSVLYVVSHQARFDEIDAELVAAARILEGGSRALPRPVLQGSIPPEPRPGSPRPPRGREDRPPMPPDFIDRGLTLPRPLVDRYVTSAVPPYFVFWRSDGTVLKARLPQSGPLTYPDLQPGRGEVFLSRQRGNLREVMVKGPERSLILIGRSIEHELEGLDHLTWSIALTGFGVFVVGLAGGWWLSGRAVRPIEKMSATAATVTASNLSQRIDLTHVDAELGQLGTILNAMLGRLETAFEQQVRFTADASHELRTPLAVILSHTEMALMRERSPEEYRRTVTTCQRAALRMKSLVESLLTLARMDSGELVLVLQPVDLSELAKECADLIRPLAEERGLVLELKLLDVSLVADAERLAQVITNLLTNAISYNRDGGRITMTLDLHDNEATLSVMDTGIGIAAEDVPHLFERFYRVDKARTRASGGNGLGLAICQGIVAAHGGRLTVTSAVGVGSTFVVRLPLVPREAQGPGLN